MAYAMRSGSRHRRPDDFDDTDVDAGFLQLFDHDRRHAVVGNDHVDAVDVAHLAESPPAEFRGVDQRDDLLHRLDHHQRQVTTHEIGRRHTVVEIETVHPEEELAARKLPEHLFGERPYDRKRTVAQHTAELDYRAFVVLRERRSDAQRRRDRRQLLHLADLARHGERRRPRSDENRVARFHEPCGIGSDGAFLVGTEFLLVVDVTLLNVGVGQDRRTVYAVKHLLLFEQRQILADRHLETPSMWASCETDSDVCWCNSAMILRCRSLTIAGVCGRE